MTEKHQNSASRAPINEPGLPHPRPKLLSPFRQQPNPLISKQIKINQGNSRVFKAKNNGVSYDHRSCYLFLLIVISPWVGSRNAMPLRDSRSFAPIRAYSHLFAPIRGDF
jgi:hypothetical protein